MAQPKGTSMCRHGLCDTQVVPASPSSMAVTLTDLKHRSNDSERKGGPVTSSMDCNGYLQASTAIFPFVNLPPELRNRIYRYALLRSIVYPYRLQGPSHRAHLGPTSFPVVNLLLVSRQIRSEARAMLYHENLFSFSDPRQGRQFIEICIKKVGYIPRIEFTPPGGCYEFFCRSPRHRKQPHWSETFEWLSDVSQHSRVPILQPYRIDITALGGNECSVRWVVCSGMFGYPAWCDSFKTELVCSWNGILYSKTRLPWSEEVMKGEEVVKGTPPDYKDRLLQLNRVVRQVMERPLNQDEEQNMPPEVLEIVRWNPLPEF